MTRKEIAVSVTTGFLSGIAGVVLALTASASTYGTKIDAQEKTIATLATAITHKADISAVDQLATRADMRALGELIAASAKLQERRDNEQDRRIDSVERIQSEQGKTLNSVERKVDVVIAILEEIRRDK